MLGGNFNQAEEEVYNMGFQEDAYDEEDEDETLSFCDLPIYYGDNDGSSSRWNQSSSNSFSSNDNEDENDDDCFEFSFSSSQSLEEKNIIFCGKIIPYRNEEALPNMKNSAYYYCKELQVLKGNNKSTRSCTPKGKGMALSTEKKKTWHASKNNKTSKWYLFMLGLVRIQGGNMELKDIKKRQRKSRRSSSTTFGNRSEIANYNKTSVGSSGDEIKVVGNNNKAGLLSLLRSFSCTRTPTTDVHVDCNKVKASLWCLQQLRTPH